MTLHDAPAALLHSHAGRSTHTDGGKLMHATTTETPDTREDDSRRSLLTTAFAHAFHPTIILLALLACHYLHGSPELLLPIGIGFTFLMTGLEQIMPARREWRPLSSFKQVAGNFAFWM